MKRLIWIFAFLAWLSLQGTGAAAIDIPAVIEFNCSEQDQSSVGWVNCEGAQSAGAHTTSAGSRSQITSSANHPDSVGLGHRYWIGNGTSNNSGGIDFSFTDPVTGNYELWIGWYLRYQAGFDLSADPSHKVLYFAFGQDLYFDIGDNDTAIRVVVGGQPCTVQGWGWNQISDGAGTANVSDGNWHWTKVRIKRNEGSNNDVVEWWWDGVKRLECTTLNLPEPLTIFGLPANQRANLAGDMWNDTDRITVQFTDPGEPPFGGGGGDTTPPSSVTLSAPSNGQTVRTQMLALSGACTDDTACVSMLYEYGTGTPNTEACTATSSTGNTWPCVWTTPADGSYNVRVTGCDEAENCTTSSSVAVTVAKPTTLFQEGFENSSFSARGWYDSPGGAIDTGEFAPAGGSAASFRCTFNSGANGCASGSPARHLFEETGALYVAYWVKYSSNYAGSGSNVHPHEIYVLSNEDGDFSSLSFNTLNLYIQQVTRPSGVIPQFQIQDGVMVDTGNIDVDLRGVTESRAVSACNGIGNTGGSTVDGAFGGADCFSLGGGNYYAAYFWNAATGRIAKDSWHLVEAFARINTVSGGIGQTDGLLEYWLDGTRVIHNDAVIFRTGANPDMAFRQFVIGPFMSAASPATQSFWMDELMVGSFAAGDPPVAAGANSTRGSRGLSRGRF
jgi:hypothetical protein